MYSGTSYRPPASQCIKKKVIRPARNRWRKTDLATYALPLVVSFLLMSGCGTYGKMMQHGVSGVEDYQIFDGVVIEAGTQPALFADATGV
jgi:hypothetical protein